MVPLACDRLALAASSAQPLDWVPLEGVPEGYDGPLRAELRTAADTVASYAFTGSDEAGAHFLLTPLHPRGTIEGGAVQLRFTDGATRCPA
ncbi:hypothetical protein NK914_23815, partial [Salmonella enterica subsp. enterica serovar Typhimurium]|uniref:hypothetical protein n=1 Tax=Salmonella enterica TaxID=28901 RepID=UPI0020A41037